MKKATFIFLKPRKFITAWFDNNYVMLLRLVVLPNNILQCTRFRLIMLLKNYEQKHQNSD